MTKDTAIARKNPSLPAKWLNKTGLLDNGARLDFGCGRGQDAFTYMMAK